MWEKIWNLEKQENPPNKYPNNKHEYIIHVNSEKQFKVKKNNMFYNALKSVNSNNINKKTESPRISSESINN